MLDIADDLGSMSEAPIGASRKSGPCANQKDWAGSWPPQPFGGNRPRLGVNVVLMPKNVKASAATADSSEISRR
jgi:hypothetical protein